MKRFRYSKMDNFYIQPAARGTWPRSHPKPAQFVLSIVLPVISIYSLEPADRTYFIETPAMAWKVKASRIGECGHSISMSGSHLFAFWLENSLIKSGLGRLSLIGHEDWDELHELHKTIKQWSGL